MKNFNAKKKFKVLLCAPGDELEGGIAAVVYGLKKIFKLKEDLIDYRRIIYAKPCNNIGTITRLIKEANQLIIFISQLLIYKPDIIHIQSSFDKKTIIRDSIHLWFTLLLNKKFVLHAHGGDWHLVPSWNKLWILYTKTFLTRCHKIIVTSLEEKKIINKIYGIRVKVSKINNPVVLPLDISNIQRSKTNITKIIFASRFIPTKVILDVIKAASLINKKDFKICLYGNGILFSEAQKLINSLNLQNRVFLKGKISLAKLITEYCKSDIFLFPSYHLEGFPMAFFYAVACSLPIISTRIRPIPDFLSEPDNCLWIEPENYKMLAEKIIYLINHPEIRKKMSKNNAKLAKQFTIENISRDFVYLYSQL